MLFSSLTFLFAFLPLCLGIYHLAPASARNTVLLIASAIFYAWGEGPFALVMLACIVLNWSAALLVQRTESRFRKCIVTAAVVANLLLLATFKYAAFFVQSANALFVNAGLQFAFARPAFHLPIGISFFTFHGLSYLLDVYRGEATAERNPMRIALYLALFPQLVAGPIVRYADVAAQLRARQETLAMFTSGVERFVVGLGKKVLLANTLAVTADRAFAAGPLSCADAWAGVLAYTLQIYFDFSGYSDMAIGLGRMFGFTFRENFQYPYIAGSVTEFWRRWHISLSSWFRDYVYVPLGGNRAGRRRTYANLWIVFLLCGLWHGAAWNFVVWGAFHGTFLVAERTGRSRAHTVPRVLRPLRHIYALLAIMAGWVFFRAETLGAAVDMFKWLVGLGPSVGGTALWNTRAVAALAVGAVACTPVAAAIARRFASANGSSVFVRPAMGAALMVMFWLAAASLAAGTHNPFIYFRF